VHTIYFGDNLDILRKYIKDESVDLIYLDPPFNSDQTYNILFREEDGSRAAAQIRAFEDTGKRSGSGCKSIPWASRASRGSASRT
jgi:site-specific DNA-methyltransferase (adenine-specific)